jgi:hypothetical protein
MPLLPFCGGIRVLLHLEVSVCLPRVLLVILIAPKSKRLLQSNPPGRSRQKAHNRLLLHSLSSHQSKLCLVGHSPSWRRCPVDNAFSARGRPCLCHQWLIWARHATGLRFRECGRDAATCSPKRFVSQKVCRALALLGQPGEHRPHHCHLARTIFRRRPAITTRRSACPTALPIARHRPTRWMQRHIITWPKRVWHRAITPPQSTLSIPC